MSEKKYKNRGILIAGLITIVIYFIAFIVIGKFLGSKVYTLGWLTNSFLAIPTIVMVISLVSFSLGNWIISALTVLGTFAGVLFAELLGSNPDGGHTGNGHYGWIIWIVTEVCFIAIGIVVTFILHVRRKQM